MSGTNSTIGIKLAGYDEEFLRVYKKWGVVSEKESDQLLKSTDFLEIFQRYGEMGVKEYLERRDFSNQNVTNEK